MEKLDLNAIPLDELWLLHEQITKVLSARIIAQKQELEKRLQKLNLGRVPEDAVVVDLKPGHAAEVRERRKGRGKQPRWLVSALKAGRKIEDFEISDQTRGNARASF
jgi:DNA-binding protein H-NS